MKKRRIFYSKIVALTLAAVTVASMFTSCIKDKPQEQSNDQSSANNQVKDKIDLLYTGKIQRDRELVSVSEGKNYTSTGGAESNVKTALTDGAIAGQETNDSAWSVFNYSNPIEVIIDLNGVTDEIQYFTFGTIQNVKEKIYTPDVINISVSLDGKEYTGVGVMSLDDVKPIRKIYELKLNGTIKAAFVKYNITSSYKGKLYVDELGVYKYGGKKQTDDKPVTYEPVYDGEMPAEIKEPLYWDNSESDYKKQQNLVRGIKPQVFTMNCLLTDGANSPKEDVVKITDGIYAQSASYSDEALFRGASSQANSDARLFVFDLGKTSAISGFSTSFVKATLSGVNLPESYSVFASENGVAWDVVYRKDGIRNGDYPDSSLVTIKDNFAKKKARFVAVFFDIEGHTRFDEIEIFGTKSIEGASPVSEKGDTKLRTGEYPKPEDVGGVNNILLMYHCYSNTINGTTPVTGGFSEEQCMKWIGYYDKDKKLQDTLFDTFLYLPGGQTDTWNKASMYKVYLDNLFSSGYNLDALNTAAKKVGEELKKDNFKVKVMFSLLTPSDKFTEFGDIDGDGKNEDLNTLEGKNKVIDWFINEYVTRFNKAEYSNLELAGFYWHDEIIRYNDVNLPSAIRHAADSVNKKGYIMMACPYYLSQGFYDWYNLGFDLVIKQPSYYFWNEKPQAFPVTATIAKNLGMSVEMEVEGDAVTDIKMLEKHFEYMKNALAYGYMGTAQMYYYSLPYYQSYESGTILGRQLYDLTYHYIKKTLKFTESELVYNKTFTCKPGEKLNDKFTERALSYRLDGSTKYGSIKLMSDGRFKYEPAEGFTGEDSFIVEMKTSLNETVYYEVKINVAG